MPQKQIYAVIFPGVSLLIQGQDRTNFIRQNFLRNWHFLYSSSLWLKFQPTVYCLITVTNLDLHTMPGISSLDSQHDIPNLKESKRLILYYEERVSPWKCKMTVRGKSSAGVTQREIRGKVWRGRCRGYGKLIRSWLAENKKGEELIRKPWREIFQREFSRWWKFTRKHLYFISSLE